MGDSSGTKLQLLFDAALQSYEKQTGMKLIDHPLTRQLENCHSVNSVMDVLQQQARALSEFRGDNGKAMKSLKRAVDVLHALSTSTTLGEGIGLVRSMPFICIVSLSRVFYSHSLLQNQFSLHLASYSLSVMPISELRISLTLRSIRRSRTSVEATTRLLVCLRLSNTS
jgi:fungal STAND N-terminal Goodbye domain